MARVVKTSAPVQIRFFGRPAIFMQGEEITRSLSKRAIWMLALLGDHEDHTMERQHLANVLWPESTDTAALYNLRQTLAALRRALGDSRDICTASSRSVSLSLSKGVAVDVVQFDALSNSCEPGELELALDLYREPFMVGCDEPFAVLIRQAKENAFLSAAQRLASIYVQGDNYHAALPILRRILIADPYSESACRSLMNALGAIGEWPAALEQYREFRRTLRRDLKTDTSAEAKDIYRSLRLAAVGGVQKKDNRLDLPRPLTGLVGRQTEIATVCSLLERCKLVTLSGPGGVGKTRLAIAVAHKVASQYLDGSHFVDLAPLQDEQTILAAIATALETKEAGKKPTLDAVIDCLSEREILLVLDNCEHVTDIIARLAERLLSLSRELHLLATSRQTLGVRGEFVWGVPALSVPKVGADQREVLGSESVRLFMERDRRQAALQRDSDLEAIAAICRRLDGLPLAVELAAARTNVLSPQEIETRLSDRFALLTGGTRTLERHQTLRASMEWSWELLSDDEQYLLMCLSTFRGGCNLSAIESVASRIGPSLVIDVLASLVDRSLVRLEASGDRTRYTLLETVREFADEKLAKGGRRDEAHERHRDFFLEWAEESGQLRTSLEEPGQFAAFEADHDNLRCALGWSHTHGDGTKAIRLCVALSRFWTAHGHLNEGRAQMESALKYDSPELDSKIRGQAIGNAGWMAAVQRDNHVAIQRYQQALAIARDRADDHAAFILITCIGHSYMTLRDFATAEKCLMEALDLRASSQRSLAMPYINLSEVALEQDDYEQARCYVDRTLQEMGEPSPASAATGGTYFRNLAYLDYRAGKFEIALPSAVEGLRFFKNAEFLYEIPFAVMVIGMVESGLGNWDRAVRLLSTCDAIVTAQCTPPPAYLERAQTEVMDAARQVLGQRGFDDAARAGRALDLDGLVKLALSPSATSEKFALK